MYELLFLYVLVLVVNGMIILLGQLKQGDRLHGYKVDKVHNETTYTYIDIPTCCKHFCMQN